MAKKFVKVNGLHNVFEASANIASSTIKSGASASVDANSILFITADADDVELFGSDYPSMKEGAHYIWAQGVLHNTNIGIMGATSADNYIKVGETTYTDGSKKITIGHATAKNGSFGQNTGTTTADAGGESIQFKVPKLTFDTAGHLTAGSDVTYKVSLPKEGHTGGDHKTLTVKINGGTTTYNTRNDVTIDIDSALNGIIAPFENAMHFIGKATIDLTDGATTGATALGITGYTSSEKGDIVLDKSGIHEYIWTGSAWEQIGYLVGATATQKAGYEIGKIIVEGQTTTLYGRGVTAANESKTGQTYKIGSITIEDANGTDQTINFTGVDTKYGATNGVALAGGTFFQADLHDYTRWGTTGVVGASANRYYQIRLDAAGKLAVNVPWSNTNTAHGHAAGDGIILSGGSSLGGTITIGVTAATTTKYGGIKTNYTASGKNYPVKLDTNGNAYVSVPWADPVAPIQPNNGTLTLKIAGTVGATHSANTSANATFDVPVASSSAYGVIKTGFAEANGVKKYAVKLDSNNKAYVEVPWTDRITYGLSGVVVGTTGSAAANTSVTTAVASAVSFKDTLTPSSGNATTSTCILMNGDGVINLKTISGKTNAIEIDYTGVATAEDWATIG